MSDVRMGGLACAFWSGHGHRILSFTNDEFESPEPVSGGPNRPQTAGLRGLLEIGTHWEGKDRKHLRECIPISRVESLDVSYELVMRSASSMRPMFLHTMFCKISKSFSEISV